MKKEDVQDVRDNGKTTIESLRIRRYCHITHGWAQCSSVKLEIAVNLRLASSWREREEENGLNRSMI